MRVVKFVLAYAIFGLSALLSASKFVMTLSSAELNEPAVWFSLALNLTFAYVNIDLINQLATNGYLEPFIWSERDHDDVDR